MKLLKDLITPTIACGILFCAFGLSALEYYRMQNQAVLVPVYCMFMIFCMWAGIVKDTIKIRRGMK